ncbi:MAG: hypoxanthine phosphoribosyltransferase [Fimbriimonadaceae bacterium]|nr:hypoxanthine phosphoribosyltransferase [Fimbriimonadaceae bacterium]QYK59724.1 MAG: hypoxanthine phosphoribosyltransferase [Fimbriimonadaceae bacterium]
MMDPRLKELISAEQIQRRCDELAVEIDRDYAGKSLVLLAVLKGSYMFLADLSKRLSSPVMIDFVQVSSYGDEKSSSGIVQIRKDHDVSIEGRHVLVVEDIVDTGLTLAHLCELLRTRRPLSLKVVSMLSKPAARRHEALVDYLGFEIPNEFVVGYGLDHAESFRNLPFIALLKD